MIRHPPVQTVDGSCRPWLGGRSSRRATPRAAGWAAVDTAAPRGPRRGATTGFQPGARGGRHRRCIHPSGSLGHPTTTNQPPPMHTVDQPAHSGTACRCTRKRENGRWYAYTGPRAAAHASARTAAGMHKRVPGPRASAHASARTVAGTRGPPKVERADYHCTMRARTLDPWWNESGRVFSDGDVQ